MRLARAAVVPALLVLGGCRRPAEPRSSEPRPPRRRAASPASPASPASRAAEVFVTGADRLWELGDHVVWRDRRNGAFLCAPRESPGDARPLGFLRADSLAWDGTYVYWLGSGAVQRRKLDAGAPIETIATGQGYGYNVRTDGERVFWLTSSNTMWMVRSAPVGGGPVVTHRRDPELNPPLRLGAEHVYWLRLSHRDNWLVRSLERSPKGGGEVEEVALEGVEHGVVHYDVVGGDIVYATETTRRLAAMPESGGASRIVRNVAADFDALRVADGTAFYLSDVRPEPSFGIFTLSMGGREPAVRLGTITHYQEEGFDVGERFVYWPGEPEGTIYRVRWR